MSHVTRITHMNESRHTYQVLLERGANVDTRNALGYTALMWACARGHVEVVTMLLKKGAATGLANIDSDTALIEARYMGMHTSYVIYEIGGVASLNCCGLSISKTSPPPVSATLHLPTAIQCVLSKPPPPIQLAITN